MHDRSITRLYDANLEQLIPFWFQLVILHGCYLSLCCCYLLLLRNTIELYDTHAPMHNASDSRGNSDCSFYYASKLYNMLGTYISNHHDNVHLS